MHFYYHQHYGLFKKHKYPRETSEIPINIDIDEVAIPRIRRTVQIIPKLFILTGLRNLKLKRCYGKIHDIWCEEEKEKEDFLLPKKTSQELRMLSRSLSVY